MFLNQTQEISPWLYTKIKLGVIAVDGDVASKGQGFETLKSDSKRCTLSTEPGINHTWAGCGGCQEPWGWGSGCRRFRGPERFGSGESKGQALAEAQDVLAQVINKWIPCLGSHWVVSPKPSISSSITESFSSSLRHTELFQFPSEFQGGCGYPGWVTAWELSWQREH